MCDVVHMIIRLTVLQMQMPQAQGMQTISQVDKGRVSA